MTTSAKQADAVGGKRRGRVENLRSWRPGQSGNPAGKSGTAAAKIITDEVRKLLEQPGNAGMTTRAAIAHVIVERALAGEFPFVKLVLDRVEGPVREAPEDDTGKAIVDGIRSLLAGG